MNSPATGFRRWQEDRRPVSELIEAALAAEEREDDIANDALVVLHVRGTREVLDATLAQCVSDDPKRRALAATILGQLGTPDRTFPEECRSALLDLVRRERETAVLAAAVFALGHRGEPCDAPELIALRHHPSDRIRRGVAFALQGAISEIGVQTLLELMEDPYDPARDWATTSIGMTVALDGPAIRAALLQRAEDVDEITRGEALHGLARRGDRRVVPYLRAELSVRRENTYLFENAAKTYLGINEDTEVDREELISRLNGCP